MTADSLASAPTAAIAPERAGRRAIGLWLFAIAALIGAMVLVGGLTRLTDSGLSITEWRPVTGIIPPLSEAAWQDAFRQYQAIPEYALINRGMSLEAFKTIYWWEWAHRLLGRLLGVVFLLPFLWFLVRGRIDRRLGLRLAGLFALGGAQGALGWYMVQSGLSERVDVSQYRLAAHFLLALALYSYTFWLALDLALPAPRLGRRDLAPLARGAAAVATLIFVQAGLGALVAGLDAGLTYNTWPLMDGALVPDGLFMLSPWPVNLFENITTVQFTHRLGAYLLAAAVLALWLGQRRRAVPARARRVADLLALAMLAQIGLGIATLLLVVPLPLAAAHQMMALVVLSVSLILVNALRRAALPLRAAALPAGAAA